MGPMTWQQTWLLALATGITGSLMYCIRAILTGRLVPRSVLDREREISNQWRNAHETETAALLRLTEAVQQLAGTQSQLVSAVERLQVGTVRRGGHG